MKKILTILIMLALISVTSAAVFITYNPEAKLSFSREGPLEDVNPVQCLFELDKNSWSNSIELGEMNGNILAKNISFKNTQANTYTGIMYLELECEQGLVDKTDGLFEFTEMLFTGPDGQTSTFNYDANIERISPNKVKFTPSHSTFDYESMVYEFGRIELEFVDLAYGNYTLTVYVNESEAL